MNFPEGSLVFQAAGLWSGPTEAGLLGGTGKFAGVHGSVEINGIAIRTWTITILPQRGVDPRQTTVTEYPRTLMSTSRINLASPDSTVGNLTQTTGVLVSAGSDIAADYAAISTVVDDLPDDRGVARRASYESGAVRHLRWHRCIRGCSGHRRVRAERWHRSGPLALHPFRAHRKGGAREPEAGEAGGVRVLQHRHIGGTQRRRRPHSGQGMGGDRASPRAPPMPSPRRLSTTRIGGAMSDACCPRPCSPSRGRMPFSLWA